MENVAIFLGIITIILMLFTKKSVTFTHLDFFKKEIGINYNLFDLLIVLSLIGFFLSPYSTINKTITTEKHYRFDDTKLQKVVFIFDTSYSMKKDGYLKKEKDDSESIILHSINTAFAIIVFDGGYKVLTNFTKDKNLLLTKIESIKVNMVNQKGGSKFRDTIISALNMIKYTTNSKIVIFSDGAGEDDNSVISKEEFKNLVKNKNIEYHNYNGNDYFYNSIFQNKLQYNKIKTKSSQEEIIYSYQELKSFFLYLALFLIFLKVINEKFYFISNFRN